MVRRQVGLIDFADMIYLWSHHYIPPEGGKQPVVLFGKKEGQIALANRRKDPLYLFAALQRHLSYPSVPRSAQEESQRYVIPAMQRRIERLETRIKLLEEELRGGINLARFYGGPEKGQTPG